MQQKEFYPFRQRELTIAGMLTRALQSCLIHSSKHVDQGLTIGLYDAEEPSQGLLNIAGKFRIGIRRIPREERIALFLDPLDPVQEYRLITSQVRDVLECAPLAGIDPLPELLLGKVIDKLRDGFMLITKTGLNRRG